MKRKTLVVGLALLCGIITIGLTGCKSSGGINKADLELALDQANDELLQYENRIKELEQTLKVLSGDNLTGIDSISLSGDENILNLINGKVIFPTEFKYPDSVQAANESKVDLSSRININPSSNWVIKLGGSKTEYVHPTGVRGTILLGNSQTMYKADELDVVLDEFLKGVNATNITKSRVFLNGTERGVASKVNLLIDSRPYIARVGTLGYNGQTLTFMFYYEGDVDPNKEELISSLLDSIKFGEQVLSVS